MEESVGILGGGQLGKMLCQAGSKLNIQLACLDSSSEAPASSICPSFQLGSFNAYEDVIEFAKGKDIITIEIENVNADALNALEAKGVRVYPQSSVIKIIKDKGLQKNFYRDNGIPSSPYKLYENAEEIRTVLSQGKIQLPFVQKLRTGGYDGRGVQLIKTENDLQKLFDAPSVVEDLVNISKELSVIVARNASGEVKCFPLVEMEFNPKANLVELLFCPSRCSDEIKHKAEEISIRLANALSVVGLLAVELFLDTEGNLIVNESASRTHNSGHHTIEACATSQFEQQLRAILNLPLGSTELRMPAVMINLLGEEGYTGPAKYSKLEEILAIENVFPHIYGKKETKPFRKMGHITIMDVDLDKAIQKARFVKEQIKVIA